MVFRSIIVLSQMSAPGQVAPSYCDTGEINFPNIARKLRELKFDGFIGMEFSPSDTEAAAFERTKAIFTPR